MPAMSSELEQLPALEFPEKQMLLPEIDRLYKLMSAEVKGFWKEMAKPLASRRHELPKEYMATTQSMLDILDKISGALAASVNHEDATIDQLLVIKQTAWLVRNTGGEASFLVTGSLISGHMTPEVHTNYVKFVGGTEAAWNALNLAVEGMRLPPALTTAMAATKTAYFDPQYLATRERLVDAVVNGQKPEMPAAEWSPYTVGRLGAAVEVAEGALDAAKSHSAEQRAAAQRSFVTQIALLALSLALASAAMIAVARRVIKPLHDIRDAMLKVASGDLTVDTGYVERKDEIGAL